MNSYDKVLLAVQNFPGKTADELQALARFGGGLNIRRHLSRLVTHRRILRDAKLTSELGFSESGPNWIYFPTRLDDTVLQIVQTNPGLTTVELSRLAKVGCGICCLILDHLREARGLVTRRREPDMRTAKILKDPAKYALYRLLGKDVESTAWRYYPAENLKLET